MQHRLFTPILSIISFTFVRLHQTHPTLTSGDGKSNSDNALGALYA